MTDLEKDLVEAKTMSGDTEEERWARLVEKRLLEVGEPPFTTWWWDTSILFWNSGKTALGVGAAVRSAKTSAVQGMHAVPQALYRERHAVTDSELVWANSSATVPLANGTLRMFAATMRAIGFSEATKRSKDEIKRLSPGTFFSREGSNAGAGTVEFLDVTGNRIEFRSQPASKAGLSGFTGIGFTADEAELYKGETDRPEEVLELGLSRLKGQRGARAYLISKLFSETGPLYRILARGDTEELMVARVGERGARDDVRARLHLKAHLEALAQQGDRHARVYAEDRRLTEESDPHSFIIPAWVALDSGGIGRPGTEAAIMSCWELAATGIGLDPGEVPLDGLFRMYGGRPTGNEGSRYFDLRFLRESRKPSEPYISSKLYSFGPGRRAAAIDPGTSQNSFALAIGEERGGVWRPVYLREWRGSPGAPLDLRLKEGPAAARIVRDHGLDSWATDIHGWSDIQLVSKEHDLSPELDNHPLDATFQHSRRVLHEERMSLWSDDPELDELCAQLEEEMRGVIEKRSGGKVTIVMPTEGRRHADLARAWIRCLWHARAGEAEHVTMASVAGRSPYTDQLKQAGWYPAARY